MSFMSVCMDQTYEIISLSNHKTINILVLFKIHEQSRNQTFCLCLFLKSFDLLRYVFSENPFDKLVLDKDNNEYICKLNKSKYKVNKIPNKKETIVTKQLKKSKKATIHKHNYSTPMVI